MTRARLGALAVLAVSMVLPLAASAVSGQTPEPVAQAALVVDIPGVSFEELFSIPGVLGLARSGGAALLANPDDAVIVVPPAGPGPVDGRPARFVRLDPDRVGGPDAVGRSLRTAVEAFGAEELLVIVYSSRRSPEMIEAKDELPGIVMAIGPPAGLLDASGAMGSLTSDSTRRSGVVVGGDIQATVDAFLGGRPLVSEPLPAGSPIEVVPGPPPFALHERSLAQRRMYVPVGTAAALYLTAAGLGGLGLLAAGRRAPPRWRRIVGWATLSVPMLAVGMLAAGHLPELSYATAVPMVAIVTVFGTLAFSPLERRDLTLVPAGIGVTVLACAAVEAVVGWSGMLTTLFGGTQLDGGRFYGLPNVVIGLLVGGGLWAAQRLPAAKGFVLLCIVGLFAGLPLAGANLGGAVTCFFAAGTWVAVRERARFGPWRGLAVAAATTAVGSAVVLLAHAISPVATHVTKFERDVDGIGGLLEKFVDRLQVGFDLIAGSPAAIVPVLGLPVALFVVLRPPVPVRATFERWPAWRDAVLVTILTGIVAYVVNDSGPAAAGLAFGMGVGGMLGVSLLARPGKMEPS